MKHSISLILPAFAAALLLTACGSNKNMSGMLGENSAVTSRKDGVVNNAKELATDAIDDGKKIASDAVKNGKNIASDVVKDGKEIASDVVKDGKNIASDVVEGGKNIMSDAAEDLRDAMDKGDGDGDYRTDRDGRVRSDD